MTKKKMFINVLGQQNTMIGGIGATITSASILATELGISSSRITNFEVIGTNVRCRIEGTYEIPANFIRKTGIELITSYTDSENLITKINQFGFLPQTAIDNNIKKLELDGVTEVVSNAIGTSLGASKSKIEEIILKNLLTAGDSAFYKNEILKTCYIPSCTALGSSSGNNGVFMSSVTNKLRVYAHPSLATNNGGNPDGDLQYVIDNGGQVTYVTNLDKPTKPTFTITDNKFNTSIKVDTITSSGTNAIDYYEVFVNGENTGMKVNAGGYIYNLPKGFISNIQLKAVDILFNKSLLSEIVEATTKATTTDFSSDLVAYYKLDSDIVDSKSGINGTNYSGTFESGKVGNALKLDGSSQYAVLPDNDVFSFTNGVIDLPFTIGMYMKFGDIAAFKPLLTKRVYGIAEWMFYYNNGFYFENYSLNSSTNYQRCVQNLTPNVGQWYFIAYVNDGAGNNKFYIDLATESVNSVVGTYSKRNNTTAPIEIGRRPYAIIYSKVTTDTLFFANKAFSFQELADAKAILESGNNLI